MILRLPEELRPRNVHYKKCELGVDLPASFVYSLRSIDSNLYPVFHPYKLLWDSIINDYAGELEDPRYQINYNYGELNLGFVLTDGKGRPVPDRTWHIWRICRPHGWAHVINIDSKDRKYLNLLAYRLYLQALYNERYGHRGYGRILEEMDIKRRDKLQSEQKDLMNEIQQANSGMLARVADNFSRGITKVTNPKKEIITSYSGQRNKSKIIRTITDEEGGLIVP